MKEPFVSGKVLLKIVENNGKIALWSQLPPQKVEELLHQMYVTFIRQNERNRLFEGVPSDIISPDLKKENKNGRQHLHTNKG